LTSLALSRSLFAVAASLVIALAILRLTVPDLVVNRGETLVATAAAAFTFFWGLAAWRSVSIAEGIGGGLTLLSTLLATFAIDFALDLQNGGRGLGEPIGLVFLAWAGVLVYGWVRVLSDPPRRASVEDIDPNAPAEYLADPNEDQEAADFYLAKLLSEGANAGSRVSLVVRVSRIQPEDLASVEARVRELYDCARVEREGDDALLAYLKPVKLERENLLKACRAMFRIILDEGVTVEIEGVSSSLGS
jgi:hypothetical protein